MKLKQIKILDKTLYYDVKHYYSEYGDWTKTSFYFNANIETKKLFRWFGPLVEYVKYSDYIFYVNEDIESIYSTRKEINKLLTTELQRALDLRARAKEINEGKIV